MITPLDIQNKEFSKGVRGYKEEDVDGFLDLLTLDLEKLITENAKMKAEIGRLNLELDKYRNSEDAVLETLEAAKALMGDISASAEKRAEILLKNAELDAELIQREARESVERLNEESVLLRNRFTAFQSKFKTLLESELEKFDTLSMEIFSQYGMEDVKPASATTAVAEGEKTKEATRIMKPVSADDMSKTMINIRIDE
ncbi:MAG: DivIVA domain-containing protein [Clostridia bacterium]|nr:DivIVA domain-containing protein [Clostridia bacterium]